MIAGAQGLLTTFRVGQPPHHTSAQAFDAERIGDHRADYLTYEGPISGGRGDVQRVWAGTCVVHGDWSLGEVQIQVGTQTDPPTWLGRHRGGSLWRFERHWGPYTSP